MPANAFDPDDLHVAVAYLERAESDFVFHPLTNGECHLRLLGRLREERDEGERGRANECRIHFKIL